MRGVSRAGLVACLAVLLMASATDAGSLYPIGSFPTSPVITPCCVVAADVDGDTVPDLVVVSADNGTGSVLLGNGDGTFQAAVSYAAGFVPASIAAADLDGDAFLDLVAGTQGFSVSVLFNLSEDSDGDGVGDATDNCVNAANPGQEASTQDGLVGLGCACLCGDVNDSCTVSGADAQDIQLQILPNLGTQDDCYDIGDPPFDEQGLCGTPQTTEPRGCDVNASGSCSGADAQVLQNSLAALVGTPSFPLPSGYDPTHCAQASPDPSPYTWQMQSIKDSVRRQFGAAASEYAVSANHISGADLDRMLAEAGLTGDERLLDVGSGAGHSTLHFARAGAEITGLDLTEEMVETGRRLAAREGLDNARFERGDAEALPFANDAFDVLTCRLCAHHFADVPAALREMRRVLRPGGRLLLCDSMAPEHDAQDAFFQAFETLRDPSHVRNYRRSEWCDMFEAAGFAPEPIGAWDLETDFDDWIARMHTPGESVRALRALADEAAPEARERFRFSGRPGVFLIPIAAFRGSDASP